MQHYVLCMFLAVVAVGAKQYDDIIQVPQAFPVAYMGDKIEDRTCITKDIPAWLDGFFFCQTSASYGNQSDPDGEKLIHLFDALSGVTAFDFHHGAVDFQFAYYPNHAYKIWDFYDRDMTVSKVAWMNLFSKNDVSATALWKTIPDPHIDYLPNIDFWKVGTNVVAATETLNVGLTFDPQTLTGFHEYPFKDDGTNPVNPSLGMVSLNVPVHERNDPDGTIWNTVMVAQLTSQTTGVFHQHIFSVAPNGTRHFHGSIPYPGTFDAMNCTSNGTYLGDHAAQASYMHSMTSTTNYVVLPLTSMLFNPCLFGPNPPPQGIDGTYVFTDEQNVRFLVFDKQKNVYSPNKIIECDKPLFPVHQFNAYETTDPKTGDPLIIADMSGYAINIYDSLMLKFITNGHVHTVDGTTLMMRFVINLNSSTCTYQPLIAGDNMLLAEFPQINHLYDGKPYQYGYFLDKYYAQNSSIVKINVNDANVPWVRFTASPTVALQEPWFVPNPGSTKEDDGVILVKGLDTSIDKSIVYVVNAQTMELIGSATAPTLVPFGLHNRYYSRDQLGMPSSTTTKPTSNPSGSSTAPAAGGSSTTPAAGGNSIPPTKGSARIGNAMATIMSSIVVTFLLCLAMV